MIFAKFMFKNQNTTKEGFEDLIYAIRNRIYKLTKILIEGGTNIHQTFEGLTPMMEVCLSSDSSENKCKIVLLLLQHGYDLNVRDRYKLTALYHAHIGGCKKVIEILQEERKRRSSR